MFFDIESDGRNNILKESTCLGGGIGGLLNLKQDGQNYAYLYDGRGNVDTILDNTQAIVAQYLYDPFGNLLAQSGTLDQPFGFSTKRYDTGTGLVYYGYRFYSPALGRWTTRDPLGEHGGLNLYAFVGNNPVNWVDPWGLARLRLSIDFDAYIQRHQAIQRTLDFLPQFLLEMFFPTTSEGIASGLEGQVMGMVCPLNIISEGSKAIVIGEGVEDIMTVARQLKSQGINAKWYQVWKTKNFPIDMRADTLAVLDRDARWITNKIKAGYVIYDIGIDPNRPTRSIYYLLERLILLQRNYPTIPLKR
ncbi:YD repeat protein [Candidatus Vecturithrix granuli]|uniref:YD repeat protein n=1 Tax=Vecturithrix granuli TaxID=1499967 RepID=A0A081C0X5_VECG1|nr:YD repeat protein [Candidatus Vecturithrix granuli]